MRLGVDLVDIERVGRLIAGQPGFVDRVFTRDEQLAAKAMPEPRRSEFFAGRFAGKEAAVKALGAGISGDVALTDIAILRDPSGEPRLEFRGSALAAAKRLALCRFEISISHERGLAVAFVALTQE